MHATHVAMDALENAVDLVTNVAYYSESTEYTRAIDRSDQGNAPPGTNMFTNRHELPVSQAYLDRHQPAIGRVIPQVPLSARINATVSPMTSEHNHQVYADEEKSDHRWEQVLNSRHAEMVAAETSRDPPARAPPPGPGRASPVVTRGGTAAAEHAALYAAVEVLSEGQGPARLPALMRFLDDLPQHVIDGARVRYGPRPDFPPAAVLAESADVRRLVATRLVGEVEQLFQYLEDTGVTAQQPQPTTPSRIAGPRVRCRATDLAHQWPDAGAFPPTTDNAPTTPRRPGSKRP